MKEAPTLKAIAWNNLCPWLLIFKTIGVAIRPSILMIAFVGLVITPFGWWLAKDMILTDSEIVEDSRDLYAQPESDREVPVRQPIMEVDHWDLDHQNVLSRSSGILDSIPTFNVFYRFAEGHLGILNTQYNTWQCSYFLLGTVWMLAVWSLFGSMICRIAVTHLSRDERTGPYEAFRFCLKRYISLFASASVPLILIGCFLIPLTVIGLLIQLQFLLVLTSFVWFLVLSIGLIMAIILLPLFFGWPLLWPAVVTENTDPFNAVSRAYSYPTQRPFRYLFYVCLILLVGFLGNWVIDTIGSQSIKLSNWGISWGMGSPAVETINNPEGKSSVSEPGLFEDQTPTDLEIDEETSSMTTSAARMISFWKTTFLLITTGFNYGFFFVATTALYLLLRKDTDFTELEESYVDPLPEPQQLPPLDSLPSMVPDQLKESEADVTIVETVPETPAKPPQPNPMSSSGNESDLSSESEASGSEAAESDADDGELRAEPDENDNR